VLADFRPPAGADEVGAMLDEFILRRTEEGGAPPVS
jgi:trimethylamine--corrinoid protein Co-methyltransferase